MRTIEQLACFGIYIVHEVRKYEKFVSYNFTNIVQMRLPFHFSIYCNIQGIMFMYLLNVCLFKGENLVDASDVWQSPYFFFLQGV